MSRIRIRFTLMALIGTLLAGCGGAPDHSEALAFQGPGARDSDTPFRLLAGPWLDTDLGGDASTRPQECRMLVDARSDTTRSWLWVSLDFPAGSVVRVLGTGALLIVYREGTEVRKVLDHGIHVSLEADANSYLNSAGGPFTIRKQHIDAAAASPGALLVGLPRIRSDDVAVLEVRPVPRRWQYLQ